MKHPVDPGDCLRRRSSPIHHCTEAGWRAPVGGHGGHHISAGCATISRLALRPKDAAKALGISERLLWDWSRQHGLPTVRVGRVILFPIDAIKAWLNSRCTTGDVPVEGDGPAAGADESV